MIKITQSTSGFVWLHRLFDLLIPFASLLFISTLIYQITWTSLYSFLGIIGSILFLISAQLNGIYNTWRGRPFLSSVKVIFKSWLMTWAVLIVLAFLFKESEHFSRLALTSWAVLTPAILILYRLILRTSLARRRAKGKGLNRVAIIGAGALGRRVASFLNKNIWLGLKPTHFYDDNDELHGTIIDGIEVKGYAKDACLDAYNQHFDTIYICLPLRAEVKIKQLLNLLSDTTISVKFVPDFFTFDLMHAQWIDMQGIPIVSVYDTQLNRTTSKMIKRVEDLLMSSIILIVISPLMLIIALMVKATSKGPIIFSQKRYGLDGKPINVYKFRSMTTLDNGVQVEQATKNDKRITPFGSFLRKTSLDELPQFINVIQGNMSIVGPRPHAIAHNEEYRQIIPKYMQRHMVKPGITGWAQINGLRGETDTIDKMQKRIDYDLHYINSWSVWLDIKIISLTIIKGLTHENAY